MQNNKAYIRRILILHWNTPFHLFSQLFCDSDSMSVDLVKIVLENVCLLMASHTREIVASALSFIKMFLTSFSYDCIAPEVSLIVSILKFIDNRECSGK
jgi:hypothetical protein